VKQRGDRGAGATDRQDAVSACMQVLRSCCCILVHPDTHSVLLAGLEACICTLA
jgi:hypothetical protein